MNLGEYSSEGAERFKLNQGPLMRSSSLLVRVGAEVTNNMKVRMWMKFCQALDRGHGEKLASGVVAVLVLSHVVMEHRSNIGPGYRSPIGHRGAHDEADGMLIQHLPLQEFGDKHAW